MERRLPYVFGLVLLSWILIGCASDPQQRRFTAPQFGIRPDEPGFNVNSNACGEFVSFANYTQELQEAYHSRATQNRSWIYASGTTALGSIAVSAGLAAASAASYGTLALVPIAGGFASGFFAVLDNATLADIYTISANGLGTALQEADTNLKVDPTGTRYNDQQACAVALGYLRDAVTKVKNDLERARTDSAFASLKRVTAQTQRYNLLLEQMRGQTLTEAVRGGEITAIEDGEVVIGEEKKITLTVSNVNLARISFDDVKVLIGTETRSVSWTPRDPNTGNYLVTFMANGTPPVESTLEYRPVLLVGSGQTKVESRPGVVLRYKPLQ